MDIAKSQGDTPCRSKINYLFSRSDGCVLTNFFIFLCWIVYHTQLKNFQIFSILV
jgi:hypothetical protein